MSICTNFTQSERSFTLRRVAIPLRITHAKKIAIKSKAEVAIEDMMEKTSLKRARWHLVPANDKPYGCIAVTILIEILGEGLSLTLRPLDTKVAEMAKQYLILIS